MKNRIMIILLAGVAFTACKKHTPTPTPICCGVVQSDAARADYFMFGFFGDRNCNFYMIKNDSLYTTTGCLRDTASFLATMPHTKYNNSLVLKYTLPLYLSNMPDTTLGCPNCLDQGGWYIEYRVGANIKRYNLDNDTAALPSGIKNYVLRLKASVDSLRK